MGKVRGGLAAVLGVLLLGVAVVQLVRYMPVADAATTGSATTEVLVLNSAATALPKLVGREAVEVYNHGPNTIFCSFTSAGAVVDKARPILAEGSWAVDAIGRVDIWCIAKTADQVTGAATIVSEIKSK
jgi:hypothetical protein